MSNIQIFNLMIMKLTSYFTIEHRKIIWIIYVIFWLHYTSVLPSFQAYGAYSGGMFADATSALGQMYPGVQGMAR